MMGVRRWQCFIFLLLFFVGDGQYDEWQCFVSREELVEEVPIENVRYIGCVTKPQTLTLHSKPTGGPY